MLGDFQEIELRSGAGLKIQIQKMVRIQMTGNLGASCGRVRCCPGGRAAGTSSRDSYRRTMNNLVLLDPQSLVPCFWEV